MTHHEDLKHPFYLGALLANSSTEIDLDAAGVATFAGTNAGGTTNNSPNAVFQDSHYTTDQDWNSDDGSSDIPEIVFERHGSVITWYCAHGNEASYNASTVSVDVTDSYGDTLIAAYTEEKESFDGLPLTCVNNFTMKIVGAPESALDDYYVKFVCDDPQAGVNEGGPGKWVECPKEGVKTTLDASKMPHQLVKVSSSVYKFVEASWDTRTAGDDTSNPLPSFCYLICFNIAIFVRSCTLTCCNGNCSCCCPASVRVSNGNSISIIVRALLYKNHSPSLATCGIVIIS